MATPESGARLESVASVAGVSRQTVSNVLNAPERVAAATRVRKCQSRASTSCCSPHPPARPGWTATPSCWQYQDSFERYIAGSTIAGLTLLEVNQVPIIRTYLHGVADTRGSGSAKTAKSIISGILTMAVDDGVLEVNAARQTKPVKAASPRPSPRDHERALTRQERQELIDFAEQDEYANKHDIVDLIQWMAGMGSRISETLAQEDADITIRRVKVDGELVLEGKAIISGTKSPNSVDRPVDMPDWLTKRIWDRWQRLGKAASGYTFASVRTGTLRDRHNTNKKVRNVLDRAGFEWVIPHSFRRTVATLIDQAGLGVTEAAAVLGQHPHTTSRYYFGKRGDTSRAASVL